MAAADFIQVPDDSVNPDGKRLFAGTMTASVPGGSETVYQPVHLIGDPVDNLQARVLDSAPASNTPGTVVRMAGTVGLATGSNTIGAVNLNTNAQLTAIAASVAAALTDTQLRATAVPVSGTFWQATQPVSGTFWQATQPVSGTFWQATQPVSGPLTDTQLRATAVPVSGTFWQATQPVSGTFWQATQPVSGPLTDTQLRATAVPVSGPLTDTQLRATSVPVVPKSATTGGLTPYKYVSAATTNTGNVKASAGTLYHISFGSISATVAYLKLYDKASSPVLASDVPKLVIIIPANASGAGGSINLTNLGVAFANGISHAITRGITDTDTTATAINEITINLGYA